MKPIIKTSVLPPIYFKFSQQAVHFIGIPIFFFLFVILYKPFNIESHLTLRHGSFAFNATMISCILMMVLIITRLVFWGIRNSNFKMGFYPLWCLGEITISTLFIALYVCLMSGKEYAYIDIIPFIMVQLAAITVFPYLIFMFLLNSDLVTRYQEMYSNDAKMHFYDSKKNLKFVADPATIFYVKSDENYCTIVYMEGTKVKNFTLRATMKSIESLCEKYGIVRCHRSYFVNVKKINVLRVEPDGVNMAELSAEGLENIPVTPRYYDKISGMLES